MTRSVDRKKYWDLFETLRWVQTGDEQAVAELWDWRDDHRMAVTLVAMKVPRVLPYIFTKRHLFALPAGAICAW